MGRRGGKQKDHKTKFYDKITQVQIIKVQLKMSVANKCCVHNSELSNYYYYYYSSPKI